MSTWSTARGCNIRDITKRKRAEEALRKSEKKLSIAKRMEAAGFMAAGIAHDLNNIFEPFYTKKILGRSGTGLGLAVVWNTVQNHGGYVNVLCDENGTSFELYFPITRDEVAADEELSSWENYAGNRETILVIDDEKLQREIACDLLIKLGYSAIAVSSGEEAIGYLKIHSVDLIVLDMIMFPGRNGRETYERIIKIHPNQKAIIASGFAETEDVKATQKLGTGKYIKKPFTLITLAIAAKEELIK